MRNYFIIFFLLVATAVQAQQENKAIRNGNKLYRKGEYEKALPEYKKAVEQSPTNPIANYNLGNAEFRSGNFDGAEQAYDASAGNADEVFRQRAYYNKGVALAKQKKLQESIDTWKAALRMNPRDEDVRFNLQKALAEKRKQDEQKEKENKQQQQKQQQQQKDKPKPQPQQSKLDKKKIEQYLKSLQQKEQEVQRKMQQNKARGVTQPEKDW
ncbi:MAG: tetratricopeptide repeat protein [Chitinophagaceae bacterium]